MTMMRIQINDAQMNALLQITKNFVLSLGYEIDEGCEPYYLSLNHWYSTDINELTLGVDNYGK